MADNPTPTPTAETDSSGVLVIPEGQELLRVGLLGVVVGVLTPLLAVALQKFFVMPLFCGSSSTLAICQPDDLTTFYVSTIVIGVIAIALMANWEIFRPLLIALAAGSALWGYGQFTQHIEAQAAWEFYLTSALLYAVAYVLFYWLLRLRSFGLSVVLTVVAVIAIRWALVG